MPTMAMRRASCVVPPAATGYARVASITLSGVAVGTMRASANPAPRAIYDGGNVEEDAAQARVRPQDGRDQRALAAAHVDQHTRAREVVRGHHGGVERRRERGHGRVEDRRAFGVLGIHLEEGVRRARTPHRLPRDYALLELGPRVPVALVAVEDHARAERAGDLVAEERTDLGQREATVRLLGEHAEAHERAQQAAERPRV